MNDRFFDKFGFQMMQQNGVFMRLPHDIKGVFFEIRLMAGLSEFEDGTVPCGAARRAKEDDLIDYLTYGDKAKQNYFKKAFKRLCSAGVLHISPSGLVKIPYYEEEQALGRTVDTNRKRNKAQADLLELVNEAGTALKGLFRSSSATGLPYEVLVDYLRKSFGCYRPKAEEVLSRMQERGVMYSCSDGLYTLASLAPPPVAGAGKVGAGAEDSAARNIPLEPEPEPEPEKEGGLRPQLGAGQLGRTPTDSGESPETCPSDAGGGEARYSQRGLLPSTDSPDMMREPGDAYSVPDPVHAAVLYLRTKPGWQEHSGTGKNEAGSKRILLSKWTALRERFGEREADLLWRDGLRAIFEDGYDKTWNSFVSIFVSRLNKSTELLNTAPKEDS